MIRSVFEPSLMIHRQSLAAYLSGGKLQIGYRHGRTLLFGLISVMILLLLIGLRMFYIEAVVFRIGTLLLLNTYMVAIDKWSVQALCEGFSYGKTHP